MYNLVLLFAFLFITALTYLVFAPSDEAIVLKKRIKTIKGEDKKDAMALREEELGQPFSQRVLWPMFNKFSQMFSRWTPRGTQQRLTFRLIQAGKPLEVYQFIGIKGAVALGLGVGVSFIIGLAGGIPFFSPRMYLLGAVHAAIGYLLPDLWLSRKISGRRKALEKALPDVLDLLSVSVEAGLGFDGAVQKVSEKFADPTGSEFRTFLKEVRLGKTRAEALRDLAARSGLPDLQTFVATIIQAEQMGASISKVLRVQSEHLRMKRRQVAQERAMKTPIKMLFPLVIFIFPTIFIVLLGPVVIHMLTIFRR